MRALLLFPALLLAACGSDSASSPSASSPGGAPESAAADVEACQALTVDLIVSALGVPASDVVLDQEGTDQVVAMGLMDEGEMCTYDISGDHDFNKVNLRVAGFASADDAETAFSGYYRARTAEETAQIQSAGDRAAEQMVADGRAQADDVDGMGDTLSGLADKFEYQPIADLGDQAVVEINHIMQPSMPTTAHLRDGAAIYSIGVSPDYAVSQSDDAFERIREAHVAMARAVAGR